MQLRSSTGLCLDITAASSTDIFPRDHLVGLTACHAVCALPGVGCAQGEAGPRCHSAQSSLGTQNPAPGSVRGGGSGRR